jgi:hypothetical protein
MNFMKETVLNNRPHPGPLPRERGERLPSHEISCWGICRTFFRELQSIRLLFPLPGGEGQGEGEGFN